MSLTGRTLLVPRTDAAERLGAAARERGARVVVAELVRHETVEPTVRLDTALRALGTFDWLALTSATTVAVLAERAATLGAPLADLAAGTAVAAVGQATADAAAAHGLRPHLVPPGRASAAALLAVWPVGRGTVLLPKSEIAAPTLPTGLRQRGWQVTEIVAYRTVPAAAPDPDVAALVAAGEVDVVVLTSGSTASAFAGLYGTDAPTRFCAIGPSTARAATCAGLPVHAVADQQTTPGLLAAAARALTADEGARP